MMKSITPFLWFNDCAQDAAQFYVGLFAGDTITHTTYYNEISAAAAGQPSGSVMTVAFTINGREFVALNGGPVYQLTPAFSLVLNCESQAEIDRLWDAFSAGGTPLQCGWITDRFGVSWQVVPHNITELITDSDPARAMRKTQALMQMTKIDIKTLMNA